MHTYMQKKRGKNSFICMEKALKSINNDKCNCISHYSFFLIYKTDKKDQGLYSGIFSPKEFDVYVCIKEEYINDNYRIDKCKSLIII